MSVLRSEPFIVCLLGICTAIAMGQGCCQWRDGYSAEKGFPSIKTEENFISRYNSCGRPVPIGRYATYGETFGFALRAHYSAERVPLVLYLIEAEQWEVNQMLLCLIRENKFSAGEKELAACILWEKEKRTKRFSSVLVEYYVNKLRLPNYHVTGVDGDLAYIKRPILIIPDTDTSKATNYIFCRHVLPRISEFGRYAIPYLLPMLKDKDLEVRINVYFGLKWITNLELPYDPVSGKDSGTEKLLNEKGWPTKLDDLLKDDA